jgi:hypothetical protein
MFLIPERLVSCLGYHNLDVVDCCFDVLAHLVPSVMTALKDLMNMVACLLMP